MSKVKIQWSHNLQDLKWEKIDDRENMDVGVY